ncbi:MAG TPA: 8-amino-7-oxononanoate synthase [Lacipirellulaceae bacterium]|nr:8-amino-7-oxononanoate synthase [Lacipirellulaceae bacterium]
MPHDPLAWIDGELARLDDAGLRRKLAVREGPQSARLVMDGKELINFGCNDYLELAADPRVVTAAVDATQREGWGSGASPLVSGRSEAHAALERQLAEFEETEAALVFPSGFAANAGIIPALVEDEDAIFCDAKNHASLIDGCRLSKAARFVYPHGDCAALEKLLQTADRFRRRLIASDTLFSMDGDLAPLAELADLAQKYDAMLMVDEAHATGVFGENGRGVVEMLDAGCSTLQNTGASLTTRFLLGPHTEARYPLPGPPPKGEGALKPDRASSIQHRVSAPHDRVHVRVGTLSKALGSSGGFVCGRRSLIEWLANRARSYIFSTAQPAATCAAAIAALDIVRTEPHRRERLLASATELRFRLQDQGWNTGLSESQIIPMVIGDAKRTMELAGRLKAAGFFVPGIRPPSVPEGESLLRISLCFHHTPEMVDELVGALRGLR